MVCGDIPFETDSQIKHAHLTYRPEHRLSEEVKDCIEQCLTVNVNARISLKDLASHPWLRNEESEDEGHNNPTLQRTLSAPMNVVNQALASAAATTACQVQAGLLSPGSGLDSGVKSMSTSPYSNAQQQQSIAENTSSSNATNGENQGRQNGPLVNASSAQYLSPGALPAFRLGSLTCSGTSNLDEEDEGISSMSISPMSSVSMRPVSSKQPAGNEAISHLQQTESMSDMCENDILFESVKLQQSSSFLDKPEGSSSPPIHHQKFQNSNRHSNIIIVTPPTV